MSTYNVSVTMPDGTTQWVAGVTYPSLTFQMNTLQANAHVFTNPGAAEAIAFLIGGAVVTV